MVPTQKSSGATPYDRLVSLAASSNTAAIGKNRAERSACCLLLLLCVRLLTNGMGAQVWCEGWTSWSPRGSYLATYHRQGIVLWGGDAFERVGKFGHPHVQLVDFSP